MGARLLQLGLLTGCALSSVSAAAQLDLGSRLADPLAAPGQADSLGASKHSHSTLTSADAARQVQSLYGGRVLAVQQNADGFRVKILKDGEVRIYSVSPEE